MNYTIFESNLADLTDRIAKLSKRSVRLGGAPITLRPLKISDEPHPTRPNAYVRKVEVELVGETPKYAGWSFIATIAHTPDGNVIRAIPGVEIDPKFRSNAPICDHCRTARNRRDTYVVRHDDGRVMQVGSDCMKDFLGHTNPAHLLTISELLLHAFETCHYSGGNTGGREIERISLMDFLGHVAQTVLKTGRYITRKMVNESEGCDLIATSSVALNQLRSGQPQEVTEEAKALAQAAQRYVISRFAPALAEEGDDDVLLASVMANLTGTNDRIQDFEHNLLTCAKSVAIEPRFAGIAAYIVQYYVKATGALRREQTQLGEAYQRIFAMFAKAQGALKNPAISLQDATGKHIRLTLAKSTSKNAGCVYVKGGTGFEAPYYGKITPEGRFLPVAQCPSSVEAHLKAFAANPEEVAAAYGHLTGNCCFCCHKLNDERSTSVGYGPVCATKFGLAWGSRPVKQAEMAVAA